MNLDDLETAQPPAGLSCDGWLFFWFFGFVEANRKAPTQLFYTFFSCLSHTPAGPTSECVAIERTLNAVVRAAWYINKHLALTCPLSPTRTCAHTLHCSAGGGSSCDWMWTQMHTLTALRSRFPPAIKVVQVEKSSEEEPLLSGDKIKARSATCHCPSHSVLIMFPLEKRLLLLSTALVSVKPS